ncbi:hypothetical protein GCM10028824_36650 [Hymenobacter segetis]
MTITNFNPAYTYTMVGTDVSPRPSALGAGTSVPNSSKFFVQGNATWTPGGTFTIVASNSCGSSPVQQFDVTYPPCDPNPYERYAISPNPAADEVVVHTNESNSASKGRAANGLTSVQIYDSYGTLRLEQRGENALDVRLRVAKLPEGLYTVHLLRNGKVVERQNIQIKR